MENTFKILYTIGHETLRKPKATGKATPACHRVAEENEKSAGSVPENRLLCKFGISLVERVSEERLKSIRFETSAWEATQIESSSTADVDTVSPERSDELRIYDRPLDSAPCDRSDRRPFWHFLSSQSSVEIPNGAGLELPETGETSTGTGREGDCILEKHHVAVYKKKPKNLELIWCSSMKVDFSWFLTLSEHGHQEERLQSCAVRIDGKKSRPSRLSVSPQNGNASRFMLGFILTRTSNLPKLHGFSAICSNTSVVTWYCSGTAAPRIKEPRSVNLSVSIPVCTVIVSQDMLQNSIQTNSSGIRLNALCPIVFQETWDILNNFCILHSRECGNHKIYFGHVFMLQSYHGANNSFHYLCVNQ